jgi:hypothetical protein
MYDIRHGAQIRSIIASLAIDCAGGIVSADFKEAKHLLPLLQINRMIFYCLILTA